MNHSSKELYDAAARYLRQQGEEFGPDVLIDRSEQIHAAPAAPPRTRMQADDPVLFEETPTDGREEAWRQASGLDELHRMIGGCLKCPLGSTRRNFVFGVGDPRAKAMLVGEAPGADEDAKGEPFVGRAGQLLNKILEAIGFKRQEVFICNILKCRPPNNRDPLASEVEQCEPYLHRQIEILQPKIILALGRIAGQTLLRTNDTLTTMRSRIHTYRGVPLMVTFHPAAILRNPNWKRPTWEDVQKFRRLYDELTA